MTRPSEPAAETAPMVTLRFAAETVREATVMVMLEAVQDRARPTQMPAPSVKTSGVVANIMKTRPAA
jgi:hypothetical protein